ncbi:MAG: type II toxin-antitoxin system VapB family antitoxin [Azoarcus sp.]|jgi:Arc/MetJ family transcription regulator|nr:type II toxin-antitoxin system VapB family antitoxin [Azoarcus sp.]
MRAKLEAGIGMRVKVVIDDTLIDEVLGATGLKTRREAVELGLLMLLRVQRRTGSGINGLLREIEWERCLMTLQRDNAPVLQ